MDSVLSRKQQRIRQRRLNVIREAIRSRQFTTDQLTKQAVEFVLEGLKIAKNRDQIIETAKEK